MVRPSASAPSRCVYALCSLLALPAVGYQATHPQQPGQPGTTQGSGSSGTDNSTRPARVPLSTQIGPGQGNNAPNANGADSNQPLEFESHGMAYEALTRNNITVMFAPLPPHVKDFQIMQVTVTNGSPVSWTVRATDFSFVRQDGTILQALTADDVVSSLLDRAGRNDVIKLQLLYENSIYALSNYRPTNGYEQRREAALAQFVNFRFSAAAAASAIAFAPQKLKAGESTDGAIFFELHGKERTLGTGRLVAHTCGETFSFNVLAEPKTH